MKHEVSFYQGMGNSYQVDLESVLHNKKYNFLLNKSVNENYYLEDFISKVDVIKAQKKYSSNSSKKDKQNIVPVNEMTAREIVAEADKARLQRSRDTRIVCKFERVMPNRGWIVFDVSSQYTPGKHYKVYIKLKEANSLKYFKEFRKQDIVRLFLSGDIQLKCTCPDFRYRFSYMTWQLGYGLMKELRYPHIVNPQLKGSICKHCLAVLRVLQFNAASIAKQLTKTKFYKRKIEDLEDTTRSKKNKKSNQRNRVK